MESCSCDPALTSWIGEFGPAATRAQINNVTSEPRFVQYGTCGLFPGLFSSLSNNCTLLHFGTHSVHYQSGAGCLLTSAPIRGISQKVLAPTSIAPSNLDVDAVERLPVSIAV